jgi:alkanesulfonate monooxygenase SsuD/methylene tetrahydromethanopterin reductase-like flavin-dependent oxidoreductase (luciferase family)
VVKDGPRTPHPSNFDLHADHLFVDPLIAYTAMATVTTRLKFLSYVYVVPLRDPFMLAKQASSVAVMSNNRYILGTGVGWLKEEFETMGQDFHTRGKRMDEILAIVRDFWDDGYAEFKGEFFNFPRSGMFPVPERPVPIWIGGHSMPAARRAAYFDGYMPMRPLVDPDGAVDDQTQAEFALIDQIRAENGLSSPYERLMFLGFNLTDPGQARKIEEHGGVGHLQIMPFQDGMERTFDEKVSLISRFAEKIIHRV